MTHTATGRFDDTTATGRQTSKSCKKPWSLYEVAAMVGGFIVFWPLGLLAIFLKITRGEMWPGASASLAPWANWNGWSSWTSGKPHMEKWAAKASGFSNSGNAAFDDYKRDALAKLDAERRKLEDEQRAFADYVSQLRTAKDRDEFDRFMAQRNAVQTAE
jgi:Protein of unknown function (DUF2852)